MNGGRPSRTSLLLGSLALALPAGAADGPIAASVPAAVAAVVGGDALATVCATGCRSLMWPEGGDGVRLGVWPARAIGLVAGVTAGYALSAPGTPAPGSQLSGARPADAVLVGGAVAGALAVRALTEPPGSLTGGRISDCRGPEPSLPGIDAGLRRRLVSKTARGRARAARLSDATLFASVAYPYGVALGAGGEGRDLLVVSGSLLATAALTDAAKRFFSRPRPYAHFCEPWRREDLERPDARRSFFSGHTSKAFAGAVAAGSLAHYRGLPNEGWVWAAGLTMATTTGVLRIVADKHYATDVAAGAATGALMGWLLPRLHRPEGNAPTAARAVPPAPVAIALPLPWGPRSGGGTLRVGYGSGAFVEAAWRW
jgi:membrane-associated phospholipid phosphatase